MQYVFIVHKTCIKITAGMRFCTLGFKLWFYCALLGDVCVLFVDGKVLLVEGNTHCFMAM
jgi:hypothetical protein